MENTEAIASIIMSAHGLARIAAQDARNEAPSAQWRALSVLERQGGMRLGVLAAAARTTQPGMTRLIGALEQSGLVERSPDPDDSRATHVTATAQGLRELAAWRTELRDTLAPRFAGLDADDWAALRRSAEILAAQAQAPAEQSDRTGRIRNTTTGERE